PFRSYTWFPDSLSSPRNCHETVEGRLPNALVFIAERGRSFSPPPGGDGHPGPGLPLAVQPPTVVFFHDPPLPARSLPCSRTARARGERCQHVCFLWRHTSSHCGHRLPQHRCLPPAEHDR